MHHEKAADKMKDFDHFVVDSHPEHKTSKCFFVVRKGGEREDFSLGKCIENMEKQAKTE